MPESGKKHLLISVPLHASQAPDETRNLTTFLRMGTFDGDAPGMSLIAAAESFIDDTRERGKNEQGVGADKGGPGHRLNVAQRKAETARLRTRGGWQDHSDGNRLTTTLGDKVEIIRGNYKQLVLGRQEDFDLAVSTDASGGHLLAQGMHPPGYTEVKWVKTWDGTWKVTELNEKTDVHNIVHGNLKEEFYGDTKESITGCVEDTPPDVDRSQTSPKTKKNRPDISEKTWAKTITTQTGVGKAIDKISETTEVTTSETKTTVATLTDTTKVTGTATETVEGPGTLNQYTGTTSAPLATASSETRASTVDDKVHGTLTVKSYVETPFLAETTMAAAYSDVGVHLGKFELEVALGKCFIGAYGGNLDIEFAALRAEIKGGLFYFEMEMAPMYIEFFLGIKMEIAVSKEVKYSASGTTKWTLEEKIGIGA